MNLPAPDAARISHSFQAMVEYVKRTGRAAGPVFNICVNRRTGDTLPSCGARGGAELADALEAGIAARGLPHRVRRLHCMGKCHIGPTAKLNPRGPFVMGATAADAKTILDLLAAGDLACLGATFPLPRDDPDAIPPTAGRSPGQ